MILDRTFRLVERNRDFPVFAAISTVGNDSHVVEKTADLGARKSDKLSATFLSNRTTRTC